MRWLFLLPALLFGEMSREEMVAQLFVVPVCPMGGEKHIRDVEVLVRAGVGGLLVKGARPMNHVAVVNYLQSVAKVPLMVFQDAEWGLGMSMPCTISFPLNKDIRKERLYDFGKLVGEQCSRIGTHVNLAPVVDVGEGSRSFSSDAEVVSRCLERVLIGLHDGGVIGCLKHFPGHGGTTVDSHDALPVQKKVELRPFERGITAGAQMVMSGHLLCPEYDRLYPASLSVKIIRDLLISKMGFKGLVITDALNMRALVDNYPIREIALRAFRAGHHFLLYGDHISEAVDDILSHQVPEAMDALYESDISDDCLKDRIALILAVKKRLNVFKRPLGHLNRDLHTKEAYSLRLSMTN